MYRFEVILLVDGVRQVVEVWGNNEGEANVHAYQLVKSKNRKALVDVIDRFTLLAVGQQMEMSL